MRRVLRRSAGMVVVLALLLPATAAAQAAITGVVKDASGAVLPGATVEASSPVLIEKVRSVATDSTGQYRIVDLRPGVYSVTFTLTGFNAIKRDGIELTGTFVATVDAELKLGSVEETITVSGAAPTVDVQSLRVQQTVSSEVLDAIPTSRTNSNIAALVPGLTSIRPDVGGVGDNPTSQGDTGPIHGGRYIDPRSMTDGLYTNFGNGGTGTGNLVNVAGAQEVVVSTSGGLGEAETSGVIVNVIPRDGSNTFKGTINVNGANGSMQIEQLHAGAEGPGPDGAGGTPDGVRHQSHGRRANRPGSPLVLRDVPSVGEHQHGPGHVCQSEFRQHECVDVRARSQPAITLRRRESHHYRPPDMAGHAAQQIHGLLV